MQMILTFTGSEILALHLLYIGNATASIMRLEDATLMNLRLWRHLRIRTMMMVTAMMVSTRCRTMVIVTAIAVTVAVVIVAEATAEPHCQKASSKESE